MSEPPIMDVPELHAHSPAFDNECAAYSRGPLSNDSDSSPREKEVDSSSDSAEPSRYDVPELEAHLYYLGIRGARRRGPKLIFRTSKDVFTPPSDPLQEARLMQIRPVYEHDKLGKDDLWATIRSKVVGLLDRRNIKHSSVDLVRFRWIEYADPNAADEDDETNETNETNEDDGEDDDEDEEDEDGDTESISSVILRYENVVTTPITIWVGVLPDTLTGEVAFHSSNDILDLLKEHSISDVEVAYRESVVRALSGPSLFAPVSDYDTLLAVIDPVTTTLGLPIAGLKTLDRQGTLGFYFKEGDDLYGVTARHVLFPDDEGNNPYTYLTSAPKKEVVLMGAGAFTKFLASIREHIVLENHEITFLEQRITAATTRSESGGPDAEQAARELVRARDELGETRTAIEELCEFLAKMRRHWTRPEDRVIGHVVWAPPVSLSAAPHGGCYTEDVCVVKLDKEKFSQNFRGNALDLGPEIGVGEFACLMHPRLDAPSDFDYPIDRLLPLPGGILSPAEMRAPRDQDHTGDPVRYVIKSGPATHATVGCLNGFESHVRRYSLLGSRDAVEAAVCPHGYRIGGTNVYDPKSDRGVNPFAAGGDSGSVVVDARGRFAGVLTSGAGPTEGPDIAFVSPMHWLWESVKGRFPGASFDIDFDFGGGEGN